MSTAVHTTPPTSAVWATCPTCWGQRRIYEDHNGEGLVAHACPVCLGLGEQLVEPYGSGD